MDWIRIRVGLGLGLDWDRIVLDWEGCVVYFLCHVYTPMMTHSLPSIRDVILTFIGKKVSEVIECTLLLLQQIWLYNECPIIRRINNIFSHKILHLKKHLHLVSSFSGPGHIFQVLVRSIKLYQWHSCSPSYTTHKLSCVINRSSTCRR